VAVRLNGKTSKGRVWVGKCGPLMVRRKGKVKLESSELYSVWSRGVVITWSHPHSKKAPPISAQFVPKKISSLRARKMVYLC
jgi:hypothetical protein